jgi:EAL domain-containing protein (putative c-di-GMP-specific phosphodiesterase class I)
MNLSSPVTPPPGGGASPDPHRQLLEDVITGPRLRVAFQPIVDLSTGRVHGYEVLGRADLPAPLADRITGPQALLALAHQYGLGRTLDRTWRRLALSTLVRSVLPAAARIHLNIDPRELLTCPEEMLELGHRVRAMGFPPGHFVLELTEAGRALDDPQLVMAAGLVREVGFGLGIDDVGTGYSSLAAMLALRPDVIKLDRTLLSGAEEDPLRAELLMALAAFCRRADLALVAEGLETAAELRVLLRAGVRLGQGYYLARPAPLPDPVPLTVRRRRMLRCMAGSWGFA